MTVLLRHGYKLWMPGFPITFCFLLASVMVIFYLKKWQIVLLICIIIFFNHKKSIKMTLMNTLLLWIYLKLCISSPVTPGMINWYVCSKQDYPSQTWVQGWTFSSIRQESLGKSSQFLGSWEKFDETQFRACCRNLGWGSVNFLEGKLFWM